MTGNLRGALSLNCLAESPAGDLAKRSESCDTTPFREFEGTQSVPRLHARGGEELMKTAMVVALAVLTLPLFTTVAVLAQVLEDDVLSGERCKMCHPIEYADWVSTLHPNSLENLKATGHAAESCLHCMSADYRYDNTLAAETAQ